MSDLTNIKDGLRDSLLFFTNSCSSDDNGFYVMILYLYCINTGNL